MLGFYSVMTEVSFSPPIIFVDGSGDDVFHGCFASRNVFAYGNAKAELRAYSMVRSQLREFFCFDVDHNIGVINQETKKTTIGQLLKWHNRGFSFY